MRDAGFQRQRQGLGVHVRDHEKHAVIGIGDDDGNEACRVEARRKVASFLQQFLVGGRFWEVDSRHEPVLCQKSRRGSLRARRPAPW